MLHHQASRLLFRPCFGLYPDKENIGVVKDYTIRIGAGSLLTEQLNEHGEKLREVGREFGVTT